MWLKEQGAKGCESNPGPGVNHVNDWSCSVEMLF